MKIGILGSGKMGTTLGKLLGNCGQQVVIGSREPDICKKRIVETEILKIDSQQNAIDRADLVIIATPWSVTETTLKNLQFKPAQIVIDITNPLAPDVSHLTVSGLTSSAETVANLLKQARVVKAFNGINAGNLADPYFAGDKAQIFIAGDDYEAKQSVKQIIELLGFEAVDCGPLINARYLEAMAMLWIQMAFVENYGMHCSLKWQQKVG